MLPESLIASSVIAPIFTGKTGKSLFSKPKLSIQRNLEGNTSLLRNHQKTGWLPDGVQSGI